jgi:dTDP-4-amino-4,6-dideoxygalactose transaminase
MRRLPLIAPNPPKLSQHIDALARVEASGVFSNNGPEVRAFEAEVTDRLFGGAGASLAVANATLGLIVAIRQAAGMAPKPGTLALMPALTFAATAQSAIWAGLTPLICDIDRDSWEACAAHEEALLRAHGDRIGVIVPYATFGTAIDLDRYAWLAARHRVGIVIDAAASLGTIDDQGRGFGAEAPFAVVYSMHATKTFAVAEGGLIHSGDAGLIDQLRAMINFGFEGTRSATLPGINAKLPEVIAVMARAKLAEIDAVSTHRAALDAAYRTELAGFDLQTVRGQRVVSQFMPVLIPAPLATQRDAIQARIEADGVGCGRYFSPHLGQQPWLQTVCQIEPTPVADAIADRMLSLPITDMMSTDDAAHAAQSFVSACAAVCDTTPARAATPDIASVVIVGGGPAGTAMLNAATKRGLLPALAASGLVMIDRAPTIGGGRLGGYAITSDSTATTFLTAVKDNTHPELAALETHPVGRAIRAYPDTNGVPLVQAGPLLQAMGTRLRDLVVRHGGSILTQHEVLGATRVDDLWRVRVRRLDDGSEFDQLTRHLVIATGGSQPVDRLALQQVAGAPLRALAADRLIQSDDALSLGGMERIADLLATRRNPRVAIVGGSTSAIATIVRLLKTDIAFGAGGIALLHRRPLRPFYPSVEAAHAEGFTDFGTDDICPVSGFVYRLAGFRLEARDLVLRQLGVDGRAPDPRVVTHLMNGVDEAAQTMLREADIVIAALGYRPNALPLSDADGPIALAADAGGAMVDRHCRVVDAEGVPIPAVFGIGLAAGFVPWGALGGEKSFVGQANGLWQWQNDVGLMIVEQLLGAEAQTAASIAA